MIKSLALCGSGIVQLPDFMVQAEVATGRLVPVLPEWSLALMPLYALTTSRLLPTKTRSFIKFISDRLRTEFAAH